MGEEFNILAWLLMIAGVAIHRIEAISIKKYNEKHGKGGFIFTAILSFVAMLFFIVKDIIVDPNGLNFTLDLVMLGIVGGICYASASYLTFVATGCGPFVLTSLFLSYTVLVSMGYGIILGESTTVLTYIGIVLIALSLFFVRPEKKEGKGVKITLKWVLCIIASFVGSGALSVLMKYQQLRFKAAFDSEFMIIVLGFSAVSMLIIGIIKDRKNLGYIFRHGTPYAAIAGVANGATNVLGLVVNNMIDLVIAAPVRSGLKIVISFLVSRFLFGEKLSKRQIVGVALGMLALIVLALPDPATW